MTEPMLDISRCVPVRKDDILKHSQDIKEKTDGTTEHGKNDLERKVATDAKKQEL